MFRSLSRLERGCGLWFVVVIVVAIVIAIVAVVLQLHRVGVDIPM